MGGDETITDDTQKLYIGGIDPEWSSDKIRGILERHGPVKRVDIVKNFAFAFVDNQQVAESIIQAVSGETFDGCKIVVQISKNKQNLKNVDDNVCFECGNPGHWAKECEKRLKRQSREGRGRYGDRERGPPSRGRDREQHRRPDPYARDAYTARDPYARDPYASARESYARDPYAYLRDPYARDPYARSYEYERYEAARAAAYRERSPTSAYAAYRRAVSPPRAYATAPDPYAVARERLAYGTPASYQSAYGTESPYGATSYEGARRAAATVDPAALESARRALDAVRRADPYALRYADTLER